MSQSLEDLSLNPSYESIIQKNVEHLKAPYVGMFFETLEEARNYYENYGRQEGFWIRTRSSSKTREGINEVTSRQFVCAHQGKYVPKIKRHDAVEENSETETNEKDDTMKRGVNHHLQSIQFGCALLQDETEATFLWLFETWLEAMGGYHPVSIVTDQDFAMRGAIAKIKEFEEQWKTLMMENGLENNEWLNHLYEIRTSWVPVYNRSIFFARMNTTGRSEGINYFFDGFVTSTTNLKEFVVKYELALKKIMERESKEDFESEHKYRIVNDGELLLKCAAQLYTRKTKYGEPEEFVVKLNLQNYKGTCECQNFEFIGILCRHFLKVFVRLDIDTIPDHFILTRWRQEANKFRIMDSEYLVKNDGKEKSEALRLSHTCHQATKLACVAASSNEAYKTYMETLKELSKKLSDVYEDQIDVLQKKDDPGTQIHSSPSLLLDPNISQTKGRKKDNKNLGRLKSGIELAFNKKKRQYALCRKFGHDKRICASNPKRRKIESTNFGK
ncbi:hypothetical protein ACOSP7_016988 [Xanthoceras sorbifolium]